ncbi:putative ATP-dependent helicase DinG [Mycobacterium talmoniae]|uniref:Putative ATP-dependent helicase DinG n=1 Tax=Mycobacterium talmoniae TaxID=1858794 RepID=A0A2S8BNX4_9MYCO|nr:putative ATP-dependent helicase DinG [Mycobacterium talmoniae]
MSQPVSPLHLVLGDEELLVERAVASVLRAVRAQAGADDIPVDRLRAGDVDTHELAELLSPSLFADERVVVLDAAGEAGKDAAALIASTAADMPSGTVLVVVHSGGGRAKALAGQLRDLGAQVHPCAKITKPSERADFVRAEFKALRVKATEETVTALLDAVGSDIRELASACSQLVADTGGHVDAAAVRRYHSGKAEVKGFDIADKAVVGDVAGAAEALRWAMLRGEPHVVLADALADALPRRPQFALLKGRRNYLCLNKVPRRHRGRRRGTAAGGAVQRRGGRRAGRDGRDQQGGFGDAVGGFDRGGRQPVAAERRSERRDRVDADRFGADDHHDVAQVDVGAGGGLTALRGPFVGKVRCRGNDPALPRAGRQRLDPALRPADERRG